MLAPLTTLLARATVALEQAQREAERPPRNDEAYDLIFAADALRRAVTKHKAHEHIDAATFQAQEELARRGFEGLPS